MRKLLCGALALSMFYLAPAWGDDASDNAPVTRKEFNELKKDNAELKKENADLKKSVTDLAANTAADDKDYDKAIKQINDDMAKERGGMENVIIAGDAAVDFAAIRGTPTSFSAGVSPLILWAPTDKLLFEAAFSASAQTDSGNNSSSSVELGLANMSFLLCDECAIGAGLFTSPFGAYHNHFDPPWINKFPDDPLVWSDGIGPTTSVGVFMRGAIPLGSTKITYDVYGSNGPNLVTDPAAGNVGTLNHDDFTDLNNDKAIGGRIAFLPIPSLELGYSAQAASVNPPGFQNIHTFLQGVDLNFKKEIDPLGGTVQFQAQWVWSYVESAVYDPDGSLGFGPTTFNDNKNGGYVELNYRPTKSEVKFIRDLEICSRYDWVFIPMNAPGGGNEERLSLGLDYWITPSIVVQTCYEIDKRQGVAGQNQFLVQLGIGL